MSTARAATRSKANAVAKAKKRPDPGAPRPADLSPADGDVVIKQEAGVDKLEAVMRRDKPGPVARPGAFSLLAAPATHSAREVLEALAAFASAFVDHSKLPQEMMTWTVTLRDWHLVFYFSIPRPQVWLEGEHRCVPLQDLSRYVFLDNWDPATACLAEYDGAELDCYHPQSMPLNRRMLKRHGVTEKRGVPALFEKITGISITDVERAIPHGTPWWIIHESRMLFPIEWDEEP